MIDWEEALEASRAVFIEGLEQRGFSPRGADALVGELSVDGAVERVTVRLPEQFPFKPPEVFPDEAFPRSWHREVSGAMCLYAEAGREALPWLDAGDFVATVLRWLRESAAGWTDDSPDLDLHRYFHRADEDRLLVYGDLGALLGRYVRLKSAPKTIAVIGVGVPTKNAYAGKGRGFGYVGDIGEPRQPPSDWAAIETLLGECRGRTVAKSIKDGRIRYLMLAYQRRAHRAVLALEAHSTVAGIELRSLRSAAKDRSTLTIRSGSHAPELHTKKVLVVGAGAIGSFLCDALSRAGIGTLTIRDGDIIRPGNLVRHIVTADYYIGWNKAKAVRDAIHRRPYNATKIIAETEYLVGPREVPGLLSDHDLVIDATADAAATAMLAAAARATGHRILSVCAKDDGKVVRVDVIPPISGEPNPPTLTSRATAPAMFEAGCGEPVSLTPPYAVAEAAAIATRHAVGLLQADPLASAGETREHR
jgi:hypothetical protein